MPLRELALILIVCCLCLAGLWRPRLALYGYLWFAIAEPDVAAFCEAKYPFSLVLAAITLIGALRRAQGLPVLFRLPAVWGLLLLQIPLALSVVFAEGPFLSSVRYSYFLRTMLVALAIPLLIESERDLRHLLITYAIAEATFGSRFGLFGMIHGGVTIQTGYSSLYDNNEIALAIALLLPICWYCRPLFSRRWINWGLLAIMMSAVPAVIMTNSRGSSLALGAVSLCMIFRSKQKTVMLMFLVLAIGPAIYLVKDVYLDRMSTVVDYEDEASAAGRVELWHAAVAGWKDHPFLGFGFGQRNFQVVSPRYLGKNDNSVVHNTYLQMLVDSGIFALGIYCGLMFGSIIWLGVSARRARLEHPGSENIPIAIQVALIAFAVGGTFYSMQRYDLAYYFLMTAAAWNRVTKEETFEPAFTEETGDEELAELAVSNA